MQGKQRYRVDVKLKLIKLLYKAGGMLSINQYIKHLYLPMRNMMEQDYFIYKTSCELTIVSHSISPDIITAEMGIRPGRSFRKGEQTISKHSGSVITKPHNLWSIKSEVSELAEETLAHHFNYFRSIIEAKLEVLRKYKTSPEAEVIFSIWIETNNAGISFDLHNDELTFVQTVCDRVHFSVITNLP